MERASQLPLESANLCARASNCACVCTNVCKVPCLMIMSLLPQALCVSTEVSELGEYFLLPSERSLSE